MNIGSNEFAPGRKRKCFVKKNGDTIRGSVRCNWINSDKQAAARKASSRSRRNEYGHTRIISKVEQLGGECKKTKQRGKHCSMGDSSSRLFQDFALLLHNLGVLSSISISSFEVSRIMFGVDRLCKMQKEKQKKKKESIAPWDPQSLE